jgi:DNA-binding transcriptional ArsR family regulator
MSPLLVDEATVTARPAVIASLPVCLANTMCGNVNRAADGSLSPLATAAFEFWDDDHASGDELVLVAHLAGVLATTGFDALAVALGDRPPGRRPPRLATETEEHRRKLQGRVAQLRSSARRRRAYLEMLRTVWEGYRPMWEGPSGRRARRAVDRYRSLLAEGRSWRSFAPTPRREALIDQVLSAVGHDIPVILSPSTGFGTLFALDVDDALVIGLPIPEAAAEDEAEELARQLKAIAHPARLAIVREVARRPATVGELARTFGLAQPTVTNHLRQLREAGLLRRDGHGGRAFTVDRAVAREMADAVGELARAGDA